MIMEFIPEPMVHPDPIPVILEFSENIAVRVLLLKRSVESSTQKPWWLL